MKPVLISLIISSCFISLTRGTCVLESDFGFILNCNFKKSGLFRVRNLGGFKAHFGLGFSLGDELGFPESLGNVEGDRRRALNIRSGPNNIGVLPASKLPPLPNGVPNFQQSRPIALTPRPRVGPPNRLATRPPQTKRTASPFMTHAASLPLGVPAFRPIPPADKQNAANNFGLVRNTMSPQNGYNPGMVRVPQFQSLPSSVSRISLDEGIQQEDSGFVPMLDLRGHTVEELAAAANVSVEVIQKAIALRAQKIMAERQKMMEDRQAEALKQQFILQQEAQFLKEKILRAATSTTSTTTERTTTTTTVIPTKAPTMRPPLAGGSKVMNAPREYYPAGYEKNFDDNFKSKVPLPPTSFHCGDQKHFPGLYADVDLGCMVFHVCALTEDEGLIMKSFLCPESTLFDQTILKCNWWFYVDCKNSPSLYDANLPLSKSYQLMKSISYFSNYKTTNSSDKEEVMDLEALKNSVLETNQTDST